MNRWTLALADWREAREWRAGRGWWWGLGFVALAAVLWWTSPAILEQLHRLLHAMVSGTAIWYAAHPVWAMAAFCALFAALSAVSLPGCSVLALGAGAVFGPAWGAMLIALASALGAVVPFQLARHFGREKLRLKYAARFAAIDRGVQHAGLRYLLLLRLAPVIPFALVNPLMGLTTMRTWTFFWASAVGMLAGSAAYAIAGAGIGSWAMQEGMVA
jgi:uncharacterized membrane protein YdjX (TVP38/TMEM64 family)